MTLSSDTGSSLDSWWMPFTANRQFKAAPMLLARAEGMHYFTPEGRPVLDGASGLWCVNAGHGRREIVDAVSSAMTELDYAPPFKIGHPLAFQAAEALKAVLPPGFGNIFFVNSGSEAAETALKIARAYHVARGEPDRVWLIGRAIRRCAPGRGCDEGGRLRPAAARRQPGRRGFRRPRCRRN